MYISGHTVKYLDKYETFMKSYQSQTLPCKCATILYKQGGSQRNKCFQNEFLRVVSVETWQNSSKIFLKFHFTTYLPYFLI